MLHEWVQIYILPRASISFTVSFQNDPSSTAPPPPGIRQFQIKETNPSTFYTIMLPYDYLAVSPMQFFSEHKVIHKASLTWSQQYTLTSPATLPFFDMR